MKRFYARYTPEMVANICGCTAEDFTRVAEMITSTYTADRVRTRSCTRSAGRITAIRCS